ncbi:hypothetical protein L2E82_22221 [Cichorium intybus]|uniref:Uncharacterized protein n=1 Tax=Cichorium intybus TaxID=13427 RepID=A0ACB9DXJ4_CICIN|nr:hypothetical protein L2E82_22221 [Cichorium intybus]
MLQYGSGSTFELLQSETLDFDEGDATDFVVGCSIISSRQPSGIAGCSIISSHRFDDASVSSELVLYRNSSNSGAGGTGISYTNFHKNPVTSRSNFKEYYYVNLWKITVGGKTVKILYRFLVPGSDGNGGTIIDSSIIFTFMDGHVYDLVEKEFENQMSKYKRAVDVESESRLRPCDSRIKLVSK